MPDTKISALTDGSTANSTDRIPVARDAGGGTFNNRYVTPGYIGTTLLGSGTALTGSTVTTSSPVLNLTQTWNDGNVTFTGLKFNAAGSSDANSASGSLLLDLQVGGASKASITKAGAFYGAPQAYNTALFGTSSTVGWSVLSSNYTGYYVSNGSVGISVSSVETMLKSTAALSWSSGEPGANGSDLLLRRAAAATLQLGAADAAAPVAQTLQVQSVVAGTSNTAGANFTINGSKGTGTGAGGSIIFQVAPAGSSGTAQNAYSTALTITSDRQLVVGRTGAAVPSIVATAGATGGYGLNGPEPSIVRNNSIHTIFDSAGIDVQLSNGRIGVPSGGYFGIGDVILRRDAANTLALRSGTSAQTFNVYNTYTSSTNYETFKIDWTTTANTCLIGTEKGSGGGTARDLRVDVAGSVFDVNIAGARQLYVSASWTQIDSGRLDIPGTSAQIKLGGTGVTALMIKRSSTTLQARLADDSAFAPVQGKLTTDTAYTAGDPATTGYLVIYDSNGTAYKVPALAV